MNKPPILEFFMSKVRKEESGCWIWTGALDTCKYGDFRYGKLRKGAHRWIYEHVKGPIPHRHYICHTCDNPSCVNPDHLWAARSHHNLKDCVAKGRHFQASQKECKHGHPLTAENVRLSVEQGPVGPKTKRHCKLCELARQRVKLGWPQELAFTLPPLPHGYRLIAYDPNGLHVRTNDAR